MRELPVSVRKTIVFAGFLLCLLFVIALTVSVTTKSQQRAVLSQNSRADLLRQVEESPELPLRVVENDDCPFKIFQATVKEISGSDFAKLTGKTTDLASVSSVPEIRLTNTSNKTITGFVILIRDPQSRTTNSLANLRTSIAPGETYVVKRENFVRPDNVTMIENGKTRQKLVQPKLDSEKLWLEFADRSDLFVTVGVVRLDDGSRWVIRDGGEVK